MRMSLSLFIILLFKSSTIFWISSDSLSSLSSLFLSLMSDDFLLNLILKFSRLFLRSSYFFIPNTSLYAVLNFLFSSSVFNSARETIFSESKKKNFAISFDSMKSLMKISKPTSFVNSFSLPSISTWICSFSRNASYVLIIDMFSQEIEGKIISEKFIVTE